MELKPGYKITQIGVIPDEWYVSTVGKEFDVQLGKMLDSAKNSGIPKPYLGNRSVQWGRIECDDLPVMPMSSSDMERYRLQSGDLLVCEGGEVGRAAIWDAPMDECYYQKAIHRLRPVCGFDVRVMAGLLRLWSDRGDFSNYVTKTSIAHLPREKFIGVPMPVPTPLEQKRIAGAFADMDGLISALDFILLKKRLVMRATMLGLMSGKYRLTGFINEWNEIFLSQVGSVYGGLSGKTRADFGAGSARYIPFTNVISNVVVSASELESVNVRSSEAQNSVLKGDLLFNGSSEAPEELAFCSLMDEDIPDLYLNSFCFGFRIHDDARVDGLFLAYFFRSIVGRELVKSIAQGSTRYNLPKRAFLSRVFRIPGIKEQAAIARVLSDMDAEIAALELRRDKTRLLKKAMMQELLTGRTRLV
jgi:type I restriction enzyme S subunit